MKVLLISTNRSTNPIPVMPIGPCIVAEAAERTGHMVHFLDLMFSKKPISKVQSAVTNFKPDVIGISIRNIDNLEMFSPKFYLNDLQNIVKIIRNLTSNPIVFGGGALSVMPEEILRLANVSCAVIENGETTFPLLLEYIAQNKEYNNLQGIAHINNGDFHCNSGTSSSFSEDYFAPDYPRWLNMRAYKTQMVSAPVLTKKGCMFRCIYCTDGGCTYEFIEPEYVAESVLRYVSAGMRDIEFVDSVFNTPLKHAMEVCEAIARNKQKARIQCLELNPLHLNESLLTAMEYAGFKGMGITLESASDPVLHALQKGFTTREVYHAVDLVNKHKIPCAWIFMLGGPGETRKTVKETLLFAEKQIRPQDMAFFNIGIRIFPGTKLETIARNEGILRSNPEEMLNPVYYISPHVEASWIEQELKKSIDRNMNFIGVDTMNYPFLSTMNRISYFLGFRPPLWKYARFINRGLKLIGMK